MAKPMAQVDYSRCRPDKCSDDGVCLSKKACPHKLLIQDAPGEAPYRLVNMCRGCSDCVSACPFGAIVLK